MFGSARKRTKLQSAMEYLMTYGWAILIIAVVLGALFQLGVFNSSSFSPRAPPGACQVFRPSGPGTTTNINLMGVCTGQLPQYVAVFGTTATSTTASTSSMMNALAAGATFSAWINYRGTIYGCNGISGITNNSNSQWRMGLIGGCNSRAPYFITEHNIWPNEVAASTSNLQTNRWYHVVGTWNGTSLRVSFFVNGALNNSAIASNGIGGYTSWYITLGGYCSGCGAFNGSVANIQIYDTSFSANDIQALYAKGIGGAPAKLQNLVGWWPLNGNSNDYSGNNNNGVPTAVTFTSQYGK